MVQRLSIKQPKDEFVLVVDFRAVLSSLESVTTVSVVPSVVLPRTDLLTGIVTTTQDAAGMVIQALPSATTARVLLGGGTSGQEYQFEVLVSTSLGNVFDEDIFLPVAEL